MSWDDLITLRDRLDAMLQDIRHARSITLARTSTPCPCCGGRMVQGSASVSVRATILALARFASAPDSDVKILEKRWSKYRQSTGCDLHGRQPQLALGADSPPAH